MKGTEMTFYEGKIEAIFHCIVTFNSTINMMWLRTHQYCVCLIFYFLYCNKKVF